MRWLRLAPFGLLLALGLARVVAYLAYARVMLAWPLESFHLEAKMVLLAYRVALGEPLYPAWRDYPHVANFFGPVYFVAVGLIGRAARADIPELFSIGRAISFGAGLMTSLVVGLVAGRRYGRFAGALAGVLSLGAAPMIGFSVMVRPDTTAELLGVSGFFLATQRSTWRRVAGAALLVLAALTKQTTVVFLVAAGLALAAEKDWRGAVGLLGGSLLGLVAVVGIATLAWGPNLAAGLLGESRTPWEGYSFVRNLRHVGRMAPDLLVIPAAGIVAWLSGATGRREPAPAILAAVLLASGLGLAAKRGSDLNYDLSLRVVEGLAAAALWQAATRAGATSRARSAGLAAAVLGCLATGVGAAFMIQNAGSALRDGALLATPGFRHVLATYRDLGAAARDPKVRLLTDSGLLDLYQGPRAAFGDPWLFRMLTETGQITPTALRDRIDAQAYDLIVTTSPLDEPTYASYEFGLPMVLVERIRARYARAGAHDALFFYRPRPPAR